MYVHVCSGLMSRCITLAHAYYLLKNSWRGRKRLVVVWPIETACGIRFWEVFARDMFDDIELKIIEINLKYLDFKYGGFWLNIKRGHFVRAIRFAITFLVNMFWDKVPRLIFGRCYCDYRPPEEIGWSGKKYAEHLMNVWKHVQQVLLCNRSVYIHTVDGIIKGKEKENIDLSVIKFRKEYWKAVEEIVIPKEKYVGIHIRRTDHQVAMEASSTDVFIKKIDEIIEKHEDARFFLATDDISEEKSLRKRYGDKLIVQENKKWGRITGSEMKSGIIDCLCLSRCEYILGSYTSNFSSFAAQYGGKRLIICKNEDDG